jgi:hypothetical protein
MKKTEAEIELLGMRPGAEGVLWRLVKHWNPDGVTDWMRAEHMRMTRQQDMNHALGGLLASVAIGFARNSPDFEAALFEHGFGLKDRFQRELQEKLARERMSEGGIILPRVEQ